MLSIYVLLLAASVQISSCARILAFIPLPAKSHHIIIQPILRELAAKGHQIDYYTPVAMPNLPKNINQILSNRTMDVPKSNKMGVKQIMSLGVVSRRIAMAVIFNSMIEKSFDNEESYKTLLASEEKYDAVLFENFFGQEYTATLCHKFQARCVAVLAITDSFWANEISGFQSNPAYMLDFDSKSTNQMTFLERLHNTYAWMVSYTVGHINLNFVTQRFADKYCTYKGWESRPRLTTLGWDMDLVLMNTHVSTAYPTPKAPHVKEIGGVNVVPTKPLPKDLQMFMDSATEGVIYFSYGSILDTDNAMEDGKLEVFLEVFKNLKQKVLWKWKDSPIAKTAPANIKIQDWFPQQDLLAHKNVKAFISHGGLNSITEAINSGVPLIGTAFFGDQPRNARFVEDKQLGVQLAYENITITSLQWALNEVLYNPKYSQAMKKQSALFKDRRLKPAEEAAYWIGYVIKHGKVLQPASVKMSLYQVLLLDVMGFFIAVTVAILYIFKRILKAITGFCCRSKPEKVSKQRKVQ